MFKTALTAAIVATGVLGLSACDVKKTQEGHVQAPKYEVEKKQDAQVQMPKYDVTGPDVKVGKTEKEITVPKVEVKTAKEKEAEQQQRQMGAAGAASGTSK